MLNGITYTEVELQSTVPHLTRQLFFKKLLVNGGRGADCFILQKKFTSKILGH